MTAFALASEVSNRTRRIRWPLIVAGALTAASVVDLATGFSLTVPEKVIAEVEALVHEIDEVESHKKAAWIKELAPQF